MPASTTTTTNDQSVIYILNKTARRLAITSHNGAELLLPPFGTRMVEVDFLHSLDYKKWLEQGLIALSNDKEYIRLIERSPRLQHQRFLPKLQGWFQNWASVTGVISIGVIVPFLIIFLSVDGFKLFDQNLTTVNSTLFGRGVQFVFIAITSSIPGLLYFLFARQQLASLQISFMREILMLDPNVLTLDEAEFKYHNLIKDNYSSTQTGQFKINNSLPVLLCTVCITLGWLLTVQPLGLITSLRVDNLLVAQDSTFNYGFLGSYFFALNMLFRRYLRSDLSSKAYSHVIVRILISTILIWTVSVLPLSDEWKQSLYPLGFIIGVVPETGMALIQEVMKKIIGNILPSLYEAHPVNQLEGITLYDQARLLEEGIENIENLAHHNIVELRLRTRIPMSRLVDMFDQAILYLHVSHDGPSGTRDPLNVLRDYGIRTATDLEDALKTPNSAQQTALLSVLDQAGDPANLHRVELIYNSLQNADWIAYVRNWRNLCNTVETVYDPEAFYREMPVICANCQSFNMYSSKFCSSCGAALGITVSITKAVPASSTLPVVIITDETPAISTTAHSDVASNSVIISATTDSEAVPTSTVTTPPSASPASNEVAPITTNSTTTSDSATPTSDNSEAAPATDTAPVATTEAAPAISIPATSNNGATSSVAPVSSIPATDSNQTPDSITPIAASATSSEAAPVISIPATPNNEAIPIITIPATTSNGTTSTNGIAAPAGELTPITPIPVVSGTDPTPIPVVASAAAAPTTTITDNFNPDLPASFVVPSEQGNSRN